MNASTMSPLYVCGERRALPAELAPVAAAFTPIGGNPVEMDLRCVLQAHTGGTHCALARELPGAGTGAVWAGWEDGGDVRLAVHPDCPAVSGRDPDDACCAPAVHPGAHTYDLAEP